MPELLGFQERDFNNDQEPQEFDPNYGFVPEDLKVLHRALYENDSRAKELLMRFDPSKGLSLAEHMRTLSEPDGEEKIILTYLAKGETSPEIAKRLNRSVRAYSYMKAELIEKMGVNEDIAAVLGAVDERYLKLEDLVEKDFDYELRLKPLTPRQREVIDTWRIHRTTNIKFMSDRLKIMPRTLGSHVAAIYEATGFQRPTPVVLHQMAWSKKQQEGRPLLAWLEQMRQIHQV